MAPALNGTGSLLAASTTGVFPQAQPASTRLSSPVLFVLVVLPLSLLSVACAVVVSRSALQCLLSRRELATKQKKEQGLRSLVLKSGSSNVAVIAAGPQGPKPLLLPAMAAVRSSRGKASLASKFIGIWGASKADQMQGNAADHPVSPTLVGSDVKVKTKGLGIHWSPEQLYGFPPAEHVLPPINITPLMDIEAVPSISEELCARKLERIPEDELSVDIVEVPPSVSGSAFVSLLVADHQAPPSLAPIPIIVVHDCSRPASIVYDGVDASDRLRVPSPSWLAYIDDEEPGEPVTPVGIADSH